MQEEIKSRINQALEALNITKKDLSKLAGYNSPAQLYRIFDANGKVTFNILHGLKNAFPDLSIDWVLNGRGKMLKNTYSNISGSTHFKDGAAPYGKHIKMVGIKQLGLYIDNYDYNEFINDLPTIESDLGPGIYRDFECINQIKELNIRSGSIVRCKLMNTADLFKNVITPKFNAIAITPGTIVMGITHIESDALVINTGKSRTNIPREDINEVWEIKQVITSI